MTHRYSTEPVRPGPCGGMQNLDRSESGAAGLRRNELFWIANRFVRDELGEDLIEYGLLLAFMATVAVAVIISDPLSLQVVLTDAYQRCIDALNSL
jgi:Flp pilus assembly pilin Flp